MGTPKKQKATLYPKDQAKLKQLGEYIQLAIKGRQLTQTKIAERTGLSKPTLRNIERGEDSVSIGHYLFLS